MWLRVFQPYGDWVLILLTFTANQVYQQTANGLPRILKQMNHHRSSKLYTEVYTSPNPRINESNQLSLQIVGGSSLRLPCVAFRSIDCGAPREQR